jgi:hypothetical protein
MVLPNEGDLKAKISHDIQDVDQGNSLENLKSSRKKAYKEVRLNNQKSHQKNKAYYDKKQRRGNLKLTIRSICFALLESQAGITSLDRSGKDPSLLHRNCLI